MSPGACDLSIDTITSLDSAFVTEGSAHTESSAKTGGPKLGNSVAKIAVKLTAFAWKNAQNLVPKIAVGTRVNDRV